MNDAARPQRITVGLSPAVAAQLDKYADEHRWSRSTAAAVLLEQALQAEGTKGDDHGPH